MTSQQFHTKLRKVQGRLDLFSTQQEGTKMRGASGGGHKPTFGEIKCLNFAICTYSVVKNAKKNWLASLANFNSLIFSKFNKLKTLD